MRCFASGRGLMGGSTAELNRVSSSCAFRVGMLRANSGCGHIDEGEESGINSTSIHSSLPVLSFKSNLSVGPVGGSGFEKGGCGSRFIRIHSWTRSLGERLCFCSELLVLGKRAKNPLESYINQFV
jgi:hypothetical protein